MAYQITKIDTTPEGHLYLVVDFGNGWVEDFIFADMHLSTNVLGTVQQVIDGHIANARLYGYSGNRCDPNIVLTGKDTPLAAIVRGLL